jgi:NADPH-dependent 2,4-dienoyl-CoA reductase/sulfur reductase-like enzyme/nitrite reductase/ring-hydroxylating ferredoxin subunit
MLVGQVDGDDALLLRRGDELFAVGAQCTHYHGPLADGLVAGDTVRCPWHHACFSLRTGEALRAPALDPIACWRVERVGDMAFVRERIAAAATRGGKAGAPASVVIVGGGAAGLAAAEKLRREGFDGKLTMVSADDSPPVDRPNLSKDFLAGNAPDDWIPLRAPEFYTDNRIDLRLDSRVTAIDIAAKRVQLAKGAALDYGALLLATGAEPVRLDIAGAKSGQVFYLRTFADSKAIVAKAQGAKRALVVGASFIGLEVAASLRARGIDVHVVGPESVPLERVMGPEVGRIVREIHESHGVEFHLGCTVGGLDGTRVTLSDATTLEADFVVVGVGVRPALGLAEQAGIATDRGVTVDAYLETSAPGIYAAGDIARWPDPHTRERIRVEHWVVAERQGQAAARNILGRQRQPFDAVPFFWSQHYDVAINYVGHAEKWDAIAIDGSLAARDCAVSYTKGGQALAVVTLGRDLQSLRAEYAMETAER